MSKKKDKDIIRSPFRLYFKRNYQLYLFLVPTFIVLILFSYKPYTGLYMAFTDYDVIEGMWGSPFVGFKHFIELFQDPGFGKVMRNTLAISAIGFVFGFPLPIILALFLNEIKFMKFKRFVQTASYLPHFVSWVAIAGIMYQMFDPKRGIVNDIIAFFGFERIHFFAEPKMFWGLSVAIAIWKGIGWSSIIYLAGMAGISPDLYEACEIDGGGWLTKMRHITLPGIMPTVTVILILNAGSIFSGAGITPGFDGVFNLSNNIIAEYSDILDIYIYKQGMKQLRYDFATAMGLMFGIVNMALVYIANATANKINNSGIL